MWYRFMNLGENLGSLLVHLFYELDLPLRPSRYLWFWLFASASIQIGVHQWAGVIHLSSNA